MIGDIHRRFEGTFAAEPSALHAIRCEVAAIAVACGMSDTAVDDVRLAVSEAATNAIVHGAAGGEAVIRVTAQYRDRELTVVIGDDGAGMVPRLDSPGAGLGLPIISSVAKRVEVRQERGTEIEIVFDGPVLRPCAPGATS